MYHLNEYFLKTYQDSMLIEKASRWKHANHSCTNPNSSLNLFIYYIAIFTTNQIIEYYKIYNF